MHEPSLKRSVTLTGMMFYGIGTILGAGIYVLTGKVSLYAGYFTPFSFLFSGILAAFTGLSYAELASRYPKSAGEVYYVHKAFNLKTLSRVVGALVIISGLVSGATLVRGFVGYWEYFFSWETWVVILFITSLLGILAGWGIGPSIVIIILITIVEILGLVLVIYYGVQSPTFELFTNNLKLDDFFNSFSGIMTGTVLAFYAFIGFEDMVNLAEEVKEPKRNIPWAIIGAMAISSLLYILVSTVAVSTIDLASLRNTDAPMALIIERTSSLSPKIIGFIGLVAIINGALVQMIMASRVLYGMGKQGLIHHFFARVNRYTRTPLFSTFVVCLIILSLALFFPVETLAKFASLVILVVFTLINLSLIFIKKRIGPDPGAFYVPIIIPIIGTTLCFIICVVEFVKTFT